MIPTKSDLTIKSVASPATYWCKSGHKAREDAEFFRISGDTLPKEKWGEYCEDCLAAANNRLQQMKDDGSWEFMKYQTNMN
jgi:hypothetical protein